MISYDSCDVMRIWKAEDSVSNDASTAPLLGSYDLRRRRAHVAGIPAKIGKSGRRFPDDSCVVRPLIGDSCGRHLAISVIKKAPAAMASRAPSPDEKLEAYRCIFTHQMDAEIDEGGCNPQFVWVDEAMAR